MRFAVGLGLMLLFFTACTKEQAMIERKTEADVSLQLRQFLLDNCGYTEVESSTGAIVFTPSAVNFDGISVADRGIYAYRSSGAFPVLKEVSINGYIRDIELGTAQLNCPSYRCVSKNITLKITSGNKTLVLSNFPVLLKEHETLPEVNWTVNKPSVIEIVFRSGK